MMNEFLNKQQRYDDANMPINTPKELDILSRFPEAMDHYRTDQKYPVIYADPAWKFNFSTSLNRSFENHYPTMTLDEIQALPVSKLATDDAVLFLWAISAMLPDAIDVMRAWGFSYKSHAVWVKNQVGMGFWFRNQHELLLVGTREDMPLPLEKNRLPSVISGPRQEHSQKPA